MSRLPVDSSMLASIGYSPDRSRLELEFRDGALSCFFDVPEAYFQELMTADSKGTYFNRNIRNRFPYQLLTAAGREN